MTPKPVNNLQCSHLIKLQEIFHSWHNFLSQSDPLTKHIEGLSYRNIRGILGEQKKWLDSTFQSSYRSAASSMCSLTGCCLNNCCWHSDCKITNKLANSNINCIKIPNWWEASPLVIIWPFIWKQLNLRHG